MVIKETVLVMGASTNSARYSWLATKMLQEYGHAPICFGQSSGLCANIQIQNKFPENIHPDTVTMYLNPTNQVAYYDKIVALQPKRVLFNPGTENPDFENILENAGIAYEEACTLVLLRTGQY